MKQHRMMKATVTSLANAIRDGGREKKKKKKKKRKIPLSSCMVHAQH